MKPCDTPDTLWNPSENLKNSPLEWEFRRHPILIRQVRERGASLRGVQVSKLSGYRRGGAPWRYRRRDASGAGALQLPVAREATAWPRARDLAPELLYKIDTDFIEFDQRSGID